MDAILFVLCVAVYIGGLVLAAGWDIATRSIPNTLVGLVAVAAVLLLLLASPGTLVAHALVAVAVLVGGAILFGLGLWGAGDAKLLAAAALVLGAQGLPLLVLATALAGGVLSLLILVARFLPRWRPVSPEGVPYGVAIAAGAIIAFLKSGAFAPLTGL